MKNGIESRIKLTASLALPFGLMLLSFLLYSQDIQTIRHPKTSELIKLYPETFELLPDIPSPFTTAEGIEIVVGYMKSKRYTLIPVTQRKGESWIPDQGLWGIGNQRYVDAEDFPALARTGLHSEIELDRVKAITGRSISEITELGRPERSSDSGFMSHDEDIISVLKGDNRLVKKMGLTHPQTAKPMFHVWNLIGRVGHEITNDFEYILYNGKKVRIQADRGKPAQYSLFNDGYRGGSNIDIWRELDKSEKVFLLMKYSKLTDEQMNELITKLSRMHTGELEPYYIMHYGFYEGHTEYRTDPVAIAFIFGLRSLEEIEAAFPGKLFEVITDHFVRQSLTEGSLAEEIEGLIKELGTRYWDRAVDDLVKIGEPAVEPLIRTLHSNTRWLSARSSYALTRIGTPKAVAAVMEALKKRNNTVEVRESAALALGNVESDASVQLLSEVLGSDDPWRTRMFAANALGQIGSEKAVGALNEALKDDVQYVRGSAAEALGKIKSPLAAGNLVDLLKDDSDFVRVRTRLALVEIGETAVEPLLKSLEDTNDLVRWMAVWVLGNIQSAKAVNKLLDALKDSEFMVRDEAALALAKINSDEAVEPLMELLKDERSYVREEAAWVLGEMRADKAVDSLIRALADRESSWMAATALGEIQSKKAIKPLTEELKSESVHLRRAAAWSLAKMRSGGAVTPLIEVLQDEDWEVRMWAAFALEKIGTPEALEALREMRKKRSER